MCREASKKGFVPYIRILNTPKNSDYHVANVKLIRNGFEINHLVFLSMDFRFKLQIGWLPWTSFTNHIKANL